jgi:hypothetical protein
VADGWCVDRSINQSVDIDDVFVTIRICPDRPLLCQPTATHVLLCTLRATLGLLSIMPRSHMVPGPSAPVS